MAELEDQLFDSKTYQLTVLKKLKDSQEKYNSMTLLYEQRLKELDLTYQNKISDLDLSVETQKQTEKAKLRHHKQQSLKFSDSRAKLRSAKGYK